MIPASYLRIHKPKSSGSHRFISRTAEASIVPTGQIIPQKQTLVNKQLPVLYLSSCGHSRSRGFKLKRKTASKKLRSKFQDLKDWLRHNLTQPLAEVWATLNKKLQGHYQYYGINDNWRWLMKYREAVRRYAYRWICRRSQKGRISLRDYAQLLDHHRQLVPTRLKDLIARGRELSTDK